jgi:hypothetical protein
MSIILNMKAGEPDVVRLIALAAHKKNTIQ